MIIQELYSLCLWLGESQGVTTQLCLEENKHRQLFFPLTTMEL